MGLFKFSDSSRNPLKNLELRSLLSEFNRSLTLIADKKLLIDNIISRIKQIVPVEQVYIFLFNESTGRYVPEGNFLPPLLDGRSIYFTPGGRLFNWLSVNESELYVIDRPDVLDYLEPIEHARLDHLRAELIYPLSVMNELNGAVFLSKRTDNGSYSKDDFGLLSLLFDQAAFAIEHSILHEQQRERVTKMYRADRLAVLGELAAGAAHEIRNPLTAIRSTIQYLSRDTSDPVRSEMLTEVISEVDRINKILQGLLSFARPGDLNVTTFNFEELLSQVITLINPTVKKNNVNLESVVDAQNPFFSGDKDQLRQVLLNILMNSLDAMANNPEDREKRLMVSMKNVFTGSPAIPYLDIAVTDSGCGISNENIEKIFNPFFTTKSEGTGLGLAICYGIVRRHDGDIEVISHKDNGTSMIIHLPQNVTRTS
ncbi:MAG: ATP-binding protein [Sphingobacteriia bacterium]|nr:ATP-binding protein [Sphingobacteriia bacterium]